MKRLNVLKRTAITLSFFTALLLAVPAQSANWQGHAPLPEPLGNNAVTGHTFGDTCYIYSFMGIDTTKIWSGVSQSAYRLNTVTNQWQTLPDVPGALGRIAALAVGCGDKVYLFGGYTVAMSGTEISLDAVDIFDPSTLTWSAGAPIPVPVDDMVGGAWRDTLVYLVSGWSQTGNITNTQVYSPSNNSWDQATPFPTEGTFGGAGGVAGDFLVYADGVKGNFLMRNRVHRGAIDPGNPLSITWNGSGKHAGPALYRMASGTTDSLRMVFSGGTDNPYNFDGIGYNSVPSEPVGTTWSYFPSTEVEIFHEDKLTSTMDHRGFARCGDRLFIVGGMEAGQTVTDLVQSYLPDIPTSVASPTATEEEASGPRYEEAGIIGFPNPASHAMNFSSRERLVLRDAAIYDLAGRLVRRFANETLAAQTGFAWDLRDDSGRRVPAGAYFLRGRVFDRNVQRKITVVD